MQSSPKTNIKTILIAAGHTGGHLFPALFIARAIKELSPTTNVEFVGAGKPLEAEIIDSRGFTRHTISAVGFKKKSIKDRALFFIRFPLALIEAWRIISKTKPAVVLGAGGYVSFFPVFVAAVRRIPTWVHEVELEPGLTNAFLSKLASVVSVAHEETRQKYIRRALNTGHPLNSDLFSIATADSALEPPKRLLVVGGSQGADAIDRAMTASSALLLQRGISVVHQCRPENVNRVTDAYRAQGVAAYVVPFIREMSEAYKNCDVIVARAGAGTLLEVSVVNRPALFVPLPNAAGNEQFHNAMRLVNIGKAICVEEGNDFEQRFLSALESLLDSTNFIQMKQKPNDNLPRNGAKTIAEGVLRLAGALSLQ